MKIAAVNEDERSFTVTWADRSVTEYPYIWLRDNDPGGFHPDAHERLFDLASIDIDIRPTGFEVDDGALVVAWPRAPSPSVYGVEWLDSHRPGRPRFDPAAIERVAWDRASLGGIPRYRLQDLTMNGELLLAALETLKQTGILIIGGLVDSPDASLPFGDLVGFRRRTNFGDVFEVVSKPEPNNLAYTALELPLHTDLPNQELVPGYQLLHCYRNSAAGGDSRFADGLRIVGDLKREAPEDYALLCRIEIPWRFHDESNDIRAHRPIIREHCSGELDYLVFNAHIADLPDMTAADLHLFYPVYQRLMQRIRRPEYTIDHRLAAGEMVVFDNSRVLHGRAAFDPRSGERYLCGYYLERNEVDSRIRVIAREGKTCPWK